MVLGSSLRGDVAEDRLARARKALSNQFGDRVAIPKERQFVGFDAYKHNVSSTMIIEETDRMKVTRALVSKKLVHLAVILMGVLLCPSADKVCTNAALAADATSTEASVASLRDVKLAATTVACFECLEVSCVVGGTFENPFDPREIQVDGHFRGPTGSEVVMPAFFYQDCRRQLTDRGEEFVERVGEPFWKIRVAPTVPGRWHGVVRVRDRSGTAGFRPVEADVSWLKSSSPRPPRDWVLPCQGQPQLAGTVGLDFTRPPSTLGRLYLYGKAQHDQQKPVTLQVNRPSAGPVRLRIGRVWVLGVLEVKVDGEPVLRREFPAGPGAGPWKKSERDQRWKIYGADYDQDVVVDVPAGKHAVELFNAGSDGITIDRITLPNMPDDLPPVRGLGLKGDGCMLLWIQNAGHTFAALLKKQVAEPIENARVTVRGVPPGMCQVEWWDTTSGQVTHVTTVQATENGLPLDLPTLTTDVACKVQWARR